MTLKGFASREGTKAYSEKYGEFEFNTLGKTGLKVSQAGFGGYKIDVRSPLNLEALKKALISGINLIDTSSAYNEGNSELLIGDVLNELIDSNKLSRDAIVVLTKGDYSRGEPLEDQIAESLERLNIETIDVYLINNCESPVKIKKAFEYLEKEVQRGRIKYYGINFNNFSTNLEKIIELAEEVSKENHFAVIEFSMNLLELENKKILDLAIEKNLGVLICRPLDAFLNNKLLRLAEPIVHAAPTEEYINQELENILSLEKTISQKLKKLANKETASEIKENLFVCKELKENWQKAEDIFKWDASLKQHYLPKFHYAKNCIKTSEIKDEGLEMDLFSCTFKTGKLFSLISSYWSNKYFTFTSKIKEELISIGPELSAFKKLSNMAIYSLRCTKGVSSVLTGMNQILYVSDVLEGLKVPVNKDFYILYSII